MTTVHENKLATLAAGLRELADWLDTRPDVDLHEYESLSLDRSTQGSDEDCETEVRDWAAAMGVAAEWTTYGHLVATRRFGDVLSLRVVHCPSDGMAEYDARNELARAARWVFTCTDEPAAMSARYDTETAARDALAPHAEGCPGSHTVKLVSGELTELVQA
jgi:hypothetical protein